jgi:hypothetical protein
VDRGIRFHRGILALDLSIPHESHEYSEHSVDSTVDDKALRRTAKAIMCGPNDRPFEISSDENAWKPKNGARRPRGRATARPINNRMRVNQRKTSGRSGKVKEAAEGTSSSLRSDLSNHRVMFNFLWLSENAIFPSDLFVAS